MSSEHDEPDIADIPEAVAVIGMAGRFPGARNLDELWRNLRDGVDCVRDLTEEELLASGVTPEELRQPGYVRSAGPLADVDLFDAGFFGFSPREAEILDPQQRVFLETAWEALESAGCASESYPGWIGLFAGIAFPTYLLHNLFPNPEVVASVGGFPLMLSNDRDYFATRVSYKLNLRGTSVNVQTACSTSLVAVHMACQSLLDYQCTVALAGGVRVFTPQLIGYTWAEGGIYSPDGRCRAFDAEGRGALFSEGCGVVVLKRLSEALADGDAIHAVIRGSATNNDGSNKVGYTAPSIDGQAEVIAMAQAAAGVEPDSISYVETHGSGTPLGDPIEVAALTRAFRSGTDRTGFCALGSLKASVGHMESAAGVGGLIKTVLALENRQIPPSLHFRTPNPRIDFDSSPFYVNTRLSDWPAGGEPRRAGVSSFGMGGTNAHVVLEEAPEIGPSGPSRPWQLLLLSARTPTALEAATDRLADWMEAHPDALLAPLADISFTLRTGRRTFTHRRALVCRSREDALAALRERDPRRLLGSVQEIADRPVALMLPGLGDHYADMGLDLYQAEPAFREAIDLCAGLLRPELGVDIRTVIYPRGTEATVQTGALDFKAMLGRASSTDDEATRRLNRTLYAQPALFAVEYALAKLLEERGLRPAALVGYSLGEYVAACLAGVLSLEDALALVAGRARLIDELEAGAMLAVPLPEAEARRALSPDLSLAAVNGPSLSVVAGPVPAVEALEQRLTGQGIACRRLPTTHAFHSLMMEPIRERVIEMARRMRLAPPEIPYLSNVTGTWITAEEATDPAYWGRHLCQPVRFGEALAELRRDPARVLLEAGPGLSLTTLSLQTAEGEAPLALPTLRPSYERQPDSAFLLGTLAKLWLAGLSPDWTGLSSGEVRHRLTLPTYPFERKRYWIDAPGQSAKAEAKPAEEPAALARHGRPGHLRNAYAPPANDLKRALCEIWQDILGLDDVGVHDSFFELGGHSLVAPRMILRVREVLGVDFPMSHLFEEPTVSGMAKAVETLRSEGELAAAPEVDLVAETALAEDVRAEGPAPDPERIARPKDVFLTGVTGFLGSFLLRELLLQTGARVHCLVRARSAEAGLERIRRKLTEAGTWNEDWAPRIAAVPGDLELPRWGLSEEVYDDLAHRVDAIYHCGAWVNFTYPYKALKAANVTSTEEALRLAGRERTKPVHFISSIAAVSPLGVTGEPVVLEDADYPTTEGLFAGYGPTKWVGERLVAAARERGIPGNVYRPGVLAGDSRNGYGNTQDLVWNLIKGSIQLGASPDQEDLMDVAPVDYVAAAIVRLSLEPSQLGRTFHFPNPKPISWNEVYDVARAYGYPLRRLSSDDWLGELRAVIRQGADNALAPFAPLLDAAAHTAADTAAEQPRELRFDDRNTRAGLEGSGIACPPLDAALLTLWLDAFVRGGFLPKSLPGVRL
ncbi:MAG: thioester reductase domain-containing protein [Acidobacteriota bacterium]